MPRPPETEDASGLIPAAATAVVGMAVVIARFRNRLGASQISRAGWLAMNFGIVVTPALGIGLMALMVIGNRRGYHRAGRRDC